MGKRNQIIEETLGEMVQDGLSVLEELHSEMEDWASNMEGAEMEHLPKYDEVSEARDGLEEAASFYGGDLQEMAALGTMVLSVSQDTRKKASSRSARRSNAIAKLDAVVDEINTRLEALEEARNELQEIIENAEAVEFPGMFS